MVSWLRGSRRQDGAAAVEFALVFALILAPLLFGTLQYGFYFWEKSSANAAVREGARRASVGDYASCSAFASFVTAEGGQAVTSPAAIGRTFTKATGNVLPGVQVGDIMTVTLSFDAIEVGLVPLPNDGQVEASITSRVESVKTPLASC